MKRIFAVAIALLCGLTGTARATTQSITGLWEEIGTRILIEVQPTSQGIRVKRTDQSQWYQYELIRDGQYRDRSGNTYYLAHTGQLEWEDVEGRRRLVFERHAGRHRQGPLSSTQSTVRQSNTYIERNHHGTRVEPRQLVGTWVNVSTRQSIQIRVRRQKMTVRMNRQWINFHDVRPGIFEDTYANTLTFHRQELIYDTSNHDLRMVFVR